MSIYITIFFVAMQAVQQGFEEVLAYLPGQKFVKEIRESLKLRKLIRWSFETVSICGHLNCVEFDPFVTSTPSLPLMIKAGKYNIGAL